jgi:hypothetical protein
MARPDTYRPAPKSPLWTPKNVVDLKKATVIRDVDGAYRARPKPVKETAE